MSMCLKNIKTKLGPMFWKEPLNMMVTLKHIMVIIINIKIVLLQWM